MKIRVPGFNLKSILPLIALLFVIIAYLLGCEMKDVFVVSVLLVYIILIPSRLLNPKNIVFAYYFIWYCLAPMFAGRYNYINDKFGDDSVNMAFVLCFVTYAFAMFTLQWLLGDLDEKRNEIYSQCNVSELSLGKVSNFVLFFLFIIGLVGYITETGGVGAWLESANDAFFRRGGSGIYYLLFTFPLLILLYFEGQRKVDGKKGVIRRLFYILLLILSYIFIGSRSTTFMVILVFFADKLIRLNTFDRKSIIVIFMGVTVFVIGMIVRAENIMLSDALSATEFMLNYFDTFENLLLVMQDYSPEIMTTFCLPLNWPLVKLGIYDFSPYYDMSVWLTMEFYPNTWLLDGGTSQWPMEADMYLSFFFWGGIPLVILYFSIIAYVYRRAQEKCIWQFIYIIEGFYIISHLRGGLLIYWYYWLIPMYAWLIAKYQGNDELRKNRE